MAIKAIKVFFTHIGSNPILSDYWKQDGRDTFDKLFDLVFSPLYPYARKLANLLKRKGMIPGEQEQEYQGDLGFFLLSGTSIGTISFSLMFLVKIFGH